eukprot:9970015-Ditylum_brightwellii.AAC.1
MRTNKKSKNQFKSEKKKEARRRKKEDKTVGLPVMTGSKAEEVLMSLVTKVLNLSVRSTDQASPYLFKEAMHFMQKMQKTLEKKLLQELLLQETQSNNSISSLEQDLNDELLETCL